MPCFEKVENGLKLIFVISECLGTIWANVQVLLHTG
jgi:hypothetical protein